MNGVIALNLCIPIKVSDEPDKIIGPATKEESEFLKIPTVIGRFKPSVS